MPAVKLAKRPDQVAVLCFDSPAGSVNTLSNGSLSDLRQALDEVLRDPAVKGCVLMSAKRDNFVAGADLGELSKIRSREEAEKFSKGIQAVMNRIAESRVPFVAAIHGAALGGGLELALACRARVATDDPKTVLGLPEVHLGLLPAAGGTQRLVRLIGLRAGLPLLLSGAKVRARKALKLGLVDELVEKDLLLEASVKALASLRKRKKSALADRLLATAPARSFLFRKIRRDVLRKTPGNHPAPLAILKCVEAGLAGGLEAGLEKEAEEFSQLLPGAIAQNLVWVFLAANELKKTPATEPKGGVRLLGVLGAGLMGEGIASASLPLNPVILKDVSEQALARARARISADLEKRVQSGALGAGDAEWRKSGLQASLEWSALAGADFVIEAVFEELELKRKVLKEAEAVLSPQAVFASNTSGLPIHAIAAEAAHPERVLGMHYFSPVPKMRLLEIIATEKTAKWAVDRARNYGAAQGKSVIVVRDGPGFYTTRILVPYLNESMLLLEEGVKMEEIDRALRKFGFPVGPIALLDEVGIDVGMHVLQDLGAAFSGRWGRVSDALSALAQAGYLGKKNGKGFYTLGKKPNLEAYRFIKKSDRQGRMPSRPDQRIADRVAFMMINEAAHCLQDGVLASARDGDIGAILGLGFPPFRGGPFHFLDELGLSNAVQRMEELAQAFGPRFAPAPLLKRKAKNGEFFHGSAGHG